MATAGSHDYPTDLLGRRWLSSSTFELQLTKPRNFRFLPGQRIKILHEGEARDYSLVSTLDDAHLALCVRLVTGGKFSPLLAAAELGTRFHLSGPHGYFTLRNSPRPAVLIATGVGVAPFVAMVRSGMTASMLLHGARTPAELYYESLFRGSIQSYVPCLSGYASESRLPPGTFPGRVSHYVENHLQPGIYDFYLCGRAEMVRDVTLVIDRRFPGSMVYTEVFH
jgi:benzoate/toluate 1,2-dioxygenase reductase component